MASRNGRLSEFALIDALFAPLAAAAPGAYALKDDAATLSVPPGRELVLTTDALVESVHFFADDPPDLIAKKALRVNLSDLAAKGAEPIGYLLALSLPGRIDDVWLRGFARGLAEDQARFGIALFGGDTTATPGPLTLAVTAFGSTPFGKALRRGGAEIGDTVYVTGTIGDAGAGLAARDAKPNLNPADWHYLQSRYRLPEPRVQLGPKLIGLASAALDVSDGLIADLGHIAQVSGVSIRVEANRIPLSPALRSLWGGGSDAVAKAATVGDDYEIAFTAPESAGPDLARLTNATGVPISEIGRVEAGTGVVLIGPDGAPMALERAGFVHF
jgi:thiamine-monophosphate kinase